MQMTSLASGHTGTESREGPTRWAAENLDRTGTWRMNKSTCRYSCSEHLPSTSYAADTVLGTGEIVINTTGTRLALMHMHFSKRKQDDENQIGSWYREGQRGSCKVGTGKVTQSNPCFDTQPYVSKGKMVCNTRRSLLSRICAFGATMKVRSSEPNTGQQVAFLISATLCKAVSSRWHYPYFVGKETGASY